MGFKFQKTRIPGVLLIIPDKYEDERGFFREIYKNSQFQELGIRNIVQINQSKSRKNVIRGIHFQIPPYEQGKLVSVPFGKVFDVAVDLRTKSDTFSEWVGFELSADNGHMLWIPPGFGHGVAIMEDYSLLQYLVTDKEYHQRSERSIRWNDSDINIEWGIKNPITSNKDTHAPLLREIEGFNLN